MRFITTVSLADDEYRYRGGTLHPDASFDLETMLQIIQERKSPFSPGPHDATPACLSPKLFSYNLESLRLIMYAGALSLLNGSKNAMQILEPHRFYNSLGPRSKRQSHLDEDHRARPGGSMRVSSFLSEKTHGCQMQSSMIRETNCLQG